MATPSHTSRISPERIFTTLNAYQQSAALKSAIELDLFTKIGAGTHDVATLAKQIDASERGTRILCDYLTIAGFLLKQDNQYALAPESAVFLDRRSPAYIGSMANFLNSDWNREQYASLTEAVRKGGTAADGGNNLKPKDEAWVAFAKSMVPLTIPSSAFIAQLVSGAEGRPCKILDIAAGHGMYGITLAKQNPRAEIVAVDWPAVLEVAKENARNAGVSERFTARPGSTFEIDLGEGYDYALLTNIFHHFDPPTCEKLMRRVHAALKPGGKAITLEFVPNEDRVSPPIPASFSLTMLASTDSGDAYTFPEYERMFRNAGFLKTTLHPVPEMPQTVLVSER